MPVSYVPLLIPALLVLLPLVLGLKKGRRAFLLSAFAAVVLFSLLLLRVFVPGWILTARAKGGEAKAQYELARWTENYCEQLNTFVFWPCTSDVLGGYAWLEKSAAQDYPPALFALGVRLKYGEHVPEPPNWSGPGGNVFPQPERGQKYIDRALQLGFRPPVHEEYFYWQVYRR